MAHLAINIGAFFLVLYISICVVLFFMQDRILFKAEKWRAGLPTPADIGLKFEEGFLQSGSRNAERICFWFVPNQSARMTVLVAHGNAGNLSHRLELIKTLYGFGLSVMAFDYCGYGKSAGRPSEQALYEDIRAAYEYLVKEKKIKTDNIIIYGRSLGGAAAIDLARDLNKGRLIVDASFSNLYDISGKLYPYLPVRWLLKYEFNSIEKIKGIRVPALFVYSKEDELIPLSMGKALFDACPSEKQLLVLEHGSHNDVFFKDRERFFSVLRGFIEEKQ